MHVPAGRYEGMWRDNLKDGFGVYTFPKAYTLLFPPDVLPRAYGTACLP